MEETAQQAAAAITDTGNPLHGQTSEDTISRVGSICLDNARMALQTFCPFFRYSLWFSLDSMNTPAWQG